MKIDCEISSTLNHIQLSLPAENWCESQSIDHDNQSWRFSSIFHEYDK